MYKRQVVEWNEQTEKEIQDMIDEGITSFKLYMTYPATVSYTHLENGALINNHIPHISLFISAPFSVRVEHIMAVRNMNLKQAVRFLKKMDRQHRKYYQFYTGEKWGKPENYDLCINSANYGIKETIDVIRRMIGKRCV